jgi:hypothetical protein
MTILFKHQKKYIKTKHDFIKNINLMSCKIKYSRIVFKGVIKDFNANLLKRRVSTQKLFMYFN